MPQDPNLPGGVTDRMINEAGEARQPTDDEVHAHVCEHWRTLLFEEAVFEDAEVDGCYDSNLEQTEVLLTIRVPVPWSEVKQL